MNISNNKLRLYGIAGILGGLLLFAGDMLFYYHPVNTDLKINMGNASDMRLLLSTITALFATWLLLLGTIQVYYAFIKSSAVARNTVTACFIAIFISYGIIHGAYLSIATSSKLALNNGLDIDKAIYLSVYINNILRLFVYPFFAVLSIVFIYQVWKKNTLYPRWIIIFFPLIPFLFRGLLDANLSGKYWIIFVGGFYNLILVLFFIASTLALWNYKQEAV